ncbi:MAG: DUF370 domain-containing protein [Clostridia bacterium]|nr:DUF370 domain-containing protein [Clostridiales bacterium]MCR5803927.1 DUF370 domain-containing protein [Clostridia bacterium]
MYVHLGGDVSVIDSDITAIINLETSLPSDEDMNNFIRAEEDGNRLQYIEGDLPKSLVLTTDKTYVSSMSVSVLLKRLTSVDLTENT